MHLIYLPLPLHSLFYLHLHLGWHLHLHSHLQLVFAIAPTSALSTALAFGFALAFVFAFAVAFAELMRSKNKPKTSQNDRNSSRNGPKRSLKSIQIGANRLGSDRIGPNPGRIRFWSGPCAEVICFAEPNALPNNPVLTGTHRNPRLANSIFYQSVNPFD